MGKLIVVSNRVGPLRDSGRAGGLAVGLVDALRRRGGLWFGWSGEISEEGTFGKLRLDEAKAVQTATIDLSPADHAEFYAGYANRTLWPVLHYRLDIADFDRRFEQGYRRVNERFAARLKPMIGAGDIVWVHDYHFFRLGAELRAAGVETPIGFFLHITFPGPEILAALPNHTALLRAMLAYDVIGFQTERDRAAFVRCLAEDLGVVEHGDGVVECMGRRVTVKAFPIGIDAAAFAGYAVSAEGRAHARRIEKTLVGRRQIIGVDRIDYSKGLVERFRAFERLLEDYPENRGKVSFIQVAPPSRGEVDAYIDMRRSLERLAGHVNGRFADIDWTPIRFLTRSFPRKALAGLYRSSEIGLVTPLRDGMNLVAKEFVAAQDPESPGVLVLSRFAGAAEQMREALIVNPYSAEGVAEALQSALRMPLDERKDRWRRMFERMRANDAHGWAETVLELLTATRRGGGEERAAATGAAPAQPSAAVTATDAAARGESGGSDASKTDASKIGAGKAGASQTGASQTGASKAGAARKTAAGAATGTDAWPRKASTGR